MPSGKKLFINVDANILLDSDFVQGFSKEYLKKSGFFWDKKGHLLDKLNNHVEIDLYTNACIT